MPRTQSQDTFQVHFKPSTPNIKHGRVDSTSQADAGQERKHVQGKRRGRTRNKVVAPASNEIKLPVVPLVTEAVSRLAAAVVSTSRTPPVAAAVAMETAPAATAELPLMRTLPDTSVIPPLVTRRPGELNVAPVPTASPERRFSFPVVR